MIIVCREIDKYEDRPASHYIVTKEVDDRIASLLKIRSRFNPELTYYVTRLDEDYTEQELLGIFKQLKYRKEPYFVKL